MSHKREIKTAWRQYRKLLRRAARYSTWSNRTWVPDVLASAQRIKEHALDLERLDRKAQPCQV